MSDYIKPNEYQHLPSGVSCIYSIIIGDTNLYVGSTCCIKSRIQRHTSDCYNENRKEYNFKLYKYIRDHGGIYQFKFVILEFIEDTNNLIDREQYYYDLHRPPLNTYRPRGLPKVEYNKQHYEQNKETVLEYQKQYYEQNKEAIAEQKKQHYEQNKERFNQKHNCLLCSGKYTTQHKKTHEKSKRHQKAISQSQQ